MIETILLLAVLSVYFLPWIIASATKRKNTPAIATLNFFTGWTFIGWVIALVWAIKEN